MENYNGNEPTRQPVEQEQNNFSIPQENMEQPPAPETGGGSMFKIGSIVVILGILVLGGLYMWGYMKDKEEVELSGSGAEQFNSGLDDFLPVNETAESAIDEVIGSVNDTVADQLNTQGTSSDIGDIEADLNASDLGDVNLDNLGF